MSTASVEDEDRVWQCRVCTRVTRPRDDCRRQRSESGVGSHLKALQIEYLPPQLIMSTTAVEPPRTRRRRVDVAANGKVAPNGVDTAVPRTTSTRKRAHRLAQDADYVDPELVEDGHEAVWLDGPLALTLLPPLGSFLTGGKCSTIQVFWYIVLFNTDTTIE